MIMDLVLEYVGYVIAALIGALLVYLKTPKSPVVINNQTAVNDLVDTNISSANALGEKANETLNSANGINDKANTVLNGVKKIPETPEKPKTDGPVPDIKELDGELKNRGL